MRRTILASAKRSHRCNHGSLRRWVGGVQFSPDGTMLAYTKEDDVSIFDIKSGMNVR